MGLGHEAHTTPPYWEKLTSFEFSSAHPTLLTELRGNKGSGELCFPGEASLPARPLFPLHSSPTSQARWKSLSLYL